jgi:demethylmenaquinone methyltransferase/2-methoxy-6-polyprenyl-1,4-benzoquinol methylase|tara:strand:+ start:529 stop:1233 length:705 start_codon:yes stop_codon:yes gene_type:complete
MKLYNQDKTKLVNSVFNEVYKKYDIMNDLMSFGAHRIWKKNLITWMNPQEGESLIDVASGTGDLALSFSKKIKEKSKIVCVEPNKSMLSIGKNKLKNIKNVSWYLASAEKLPFNDNVFDFYSISFGIRNVSNINKCLQEAYRVLKTGGRFFCLEFSKVENEILKIFYEKYSKAIPNIGRYIVGKSMPYEYLINSINNFHNQKELCAIIKNNGFENVEYRNLSGGISAIHTGWKI